MDPGHEAHEGDEAGAERQEGEVVLLAAPRAPPRVSDGDRVKIKVRLVNRSL